MIDYEQLGIFYLGKKYDLDKQKCLDDELVLYESRDLVTHAVCVGMTGSGKTGLCIDLLEEAAIDNVPVIAVDPKGDLSNLLLTFDDLSSKSFLPWVDPDEARRLQITPEELAGREAKKWQEGLSEWHQDAQRIKRLKDSAEFTIYTPASSAGIPLSVLKSFNCPDEQILEDRELLREQIAGTATSILSLLGIDADPIKSKEHILLSAILDNCWKEGHNLDLRTLIEKIQNPPIKQLGALPLESFFPKKERFGLSMLVNNLLASPGFEAWLEGEPLDLDRLFYSESGKNKVSIISISHLADSDRMFFVSLLLTQLLSWMRRQSGTSSLRAIFYMDEIQGFFPPVAKPPSKGPLITLLKQARAFGLGLVLATQNPVDLDYKALGNTGTWFIGRLQTERDKMRVLDGLEGAASDSGVSFNRSRIDKLISGLSRQVFFMNDVHRSEPVIFKTRFSLSYLRGPLSRAQLKSLKSAQLKKEPEKTKDEEEIVHTETGGKTAETAERSSFEEPNQALPAGPESNKSAPVRSRRSWSTGKSVQEPGAAGQVPGQVPGQVSGQVSGQASGQASGGGSQAGSTTKGSAEVKTAQASLGAGGVSEAGAASRTGSTALSGMTGSAGSSGQTRPVLGPEIVERFAVIGRALPDGARLVYKPMLFASARLYFSDSKSNASETRTVNFLTLIKAEPVPVKWERAFATSFGADALNATPQNSAIEFTGLPPEAAEPESYKAWSRDFIAWLSANQKLEIFRCPVSGQYSRPQESERDFRIRLQLSSREERDRVLSDFSKKYADRLAALHEKLDRAQNTLDRELAQAKSLEMESAINVGSSILEAFVGRKVLSQGNIRRAKSAARSYDRANRQHEDVNQAQEAVEKIQERIASLQAEFDAEMQSLKTKLSPANQALETITIGLKKSSITLTLFCLCWAPCIRQPDGKITAAW